MKTLCCNYPIDDKRPPVIWNEFNGVVQCHNCGQVWVPKPQMALGDVALQLLCARMSNPQLMKSGKATLLPEERARLAISRAERAFIDARAFLDVLAAER